MSKTLTRSKNRVIAGVCAGVANFFGLDTRLVRIVWLALALFAGTGLILYLVLWMVMPAERQSYEDRMNERLGKRR